MKLKNDQENYGAVAQGFHWLMALLIFWAIALGMIAEEMPRSPEKIYLFVLHKSVGITVLLLVVLRFLWRLFNKPPALSLPPKQEQMAHLGHGVIYLLMVLVPLTGWLLNSAAGYPLPYFNQFPIPAIPGLSKESKELFEGVHVTLFWVLAVVIVGHVLMLVHHKFAHKLVLLPRMLPCGKAWPVGVLALVLIALIAFTVKKSMVGDVPAEEPIAVQPAAEPTTTATVGNWLMVLPDSSLKFQSAYSGEAFDGSFAQFNPTIRFDPAEPEAGVLDVTVTASSITTYNEEWDASLQDDEWFATEQFATAHYYSNDIKAQNDGFVAQGRLTLKGVTQPLAVNFVWQSQADGKASFVGDAVIDRRLFGIGTGMWADDPTIAFEVQLQVNLLLTPAQ
ncbi:cytochrome b/b6 domain-containing protein [Halioxenophilus sp. WMMB6]|uniref:cytochrome b/b6 domain-containing protein n=1 Tax=Halioxenophilus sp. WMMB6 TaxID=3073815 RepID=UPI00295E5968|nr:cytochrome b/b6 domain-containing protein [Halioxenophilus sp. WMMB6]